MNPDYGKVVEAVEAKEPDYWEEYFYFLVNRGMSSREARRKIKKEQEQRRKRGKQ